MLTGWWRRFILLILAWACHELARVFREARAEQAATIQRVQPGFTQTMTLTPLAGHELRRALDPIENARAMLAIHERQGQVPWYGPIKTGRTRPDA